MLVRTFSALSKSFFKDAEALFMYKAETLGLCTESVVQNF